MSAHRLNVLVASGASGGHIFPAVSFIEALTAEFRDARVSLLLPRRNFIGRPGITLCQVRYLPVRPLKAKGLVDFLLWGFDFLKSVFKTAFIIFEDKPSLVVGFGSIASLSAVFLGWFFRVRTVIHEQNLIPGEANKFLGRFADRIAVSFSDTVGYFPKSANKVIVTGNPLRKALKKFSRQEAADFFKADPGLLSILVMGGSQGSQSLNDSFVEALSGISRRWNLQVIHLAGNDSLDAIKEKYAALGIGAKVFPFLEEMAYAYSLSDILVSRAGATTLAEACFYRLPALLLPYPFARRHQTENASFLEKKGCAIVIQDDTSCAAHLKAALDGLIGNPEKIMQMRGNYCSIPAGDAAARLVSCALEGLL